MPISNSSMKFTEFAKIETFQVNSSTEIATQNSFRLMRFCMNTIKKCVSCWGSAPDPAGGAHNAPPDPLAKTYGALLHTPLGELPALPQTP